MTARRIGLVVAVVAGYLGMTYFQSLWLLRLDSTVHVTLYDFGLIFDTAWARVYWNTWDALYYTMLGVNVISMMLLIYAILIAGRRPGVEPAPTNARSKDKPTKKKSKKKLQVRKDPLDW